jgi:hypothetical protein
MVKVGDTKKWSNFCPDAVKLRLISDQFVHASGIILKSKGRRRGGTNGMNQKVQELVECIAVIRLFRCRDFREKV